MTIVDRQFPHNSRELGGKSASDSAFTASRSRRCPCPVGPRFGDDPDTGRGKGFARLSIDNRRPNDGDRTVFGG